MATPTTAIRKRSRAISSKGNDRKAARDADRISTKRLKAFMLAELRKTKGNISAACERVDVGRTTHYRWIKEDPVYAKDVEDIGEKLIDDIETLFLKSTIEANDRRSMRWFLERKARERGYAQITRSELTGKNGEPIQTEGHLSIESLKEELPVDALAAAFRDIVADNPDILKGL